MVEHLVIEAMTAFPHERFFHGWLDELHEWWQTPYALAVCGNDGGGLQQVILS